MPLKDIEILSGTLYLNDEPIMKLDRCDLECEEPKKSKKLKKPKKNKKMGLFKKIKKLFKVKVYHYLISYVYRDKYFGNVMSVSRVKLNTFERIDNEKQTIATHIGEIGKGDDVVILNFILLGTTYREWI